MLLLLGGAQKMGSNFQTRILQEAFAQTKIRYTWQGEIDPAFRFFVQDEMRAYAEQFGEKADEWHVIKSHIVFREQIDCVLAAKHAVFFQIWRDPREALVSDLHHAQNFAGYKFKEFKDYYKVRGRKVLLRNRIQYLNWNGIQDDRIVHVGYEDLRTDFEQTARKMLAPLNIPPVDYDALAERTSMKSMRTHWAKYGRENFIREGSIGSHEQVITDDACRADISRLIEETNVDVLVEAWDRETRNRTLFLGKEYSSTDPRRRFYIFLERQKIGDRLRPYVYKVREFLSPPTAMAQDKKGPSPKSDG